MTDYYISLLAAHGGVLTPSGKLLAFTSDAYPADYSVMGECCGCFKTKAVGPENEDEYGHEYNVIWPTTEHPDNVDWKDCFLLETGDDVVLLYPDNAVRLAKEKFGAPAAV